MKEAFDNYVTALWREYFDFKEVDESGLALEKDKTTKDSKFLLAIVPHAILVRPSTFRRVARRVSSMMGFVSGLDAFAGII